jgi:alpha-amylase
MLSNPYITLKGSSTITMNVGTSYNEPGYIAYDSAGKVITSKVNVSSNVNVKVAGTYYVTYKVTDSYGKSTTKTRTVVVKQSNIEVTGISVTPNSISLSVGGKKTIEVYITPSNATNKNVTWSSSNPTVATISNGVVIGKSRGNTVITVKTANGKTATTYVEVK